MSETSQNSSRGVVLFLLIAFGWSWSIAVWSRYAGGPSMMQGLPIIYMAGPSIAALICATLYDRGRFFHALGLRANPFNGWLVWAFLAPILLTALTMGITYFASDREFLGLSEAFTRRFEEAGVDPSTLPMPIEQLALIQLTVGPLAAAVINTLIMILTEELGWRGWLWDRWARLGFWRNAVLTGFVWGVWHAPLIIMFGHNYPDMPIAGPLLFTAWTIMFSPLIGLMRERGGSVVHAAMAHGMLNGIGPATLVFMADPSMPWRGIVGVAGFIALAAFIPIVALARATTKPREA